MSVNIAGTAIIIKQVVLTVLVHSNYAPICGNAPEQPDILLMYNNTIGPTAVRSSQFGRYLDSHREGLLTWLRQLTEENIAQDAYFQTSKIGRP